MSVSLFSRIAQVILLLALIAALASCDSTPSDVAGRPSLGDVVKHRPELRTFNAAIEAAGLRATLDGPGPYTVFAPTDAAFAALGLTPANAAEIPADVLRYHIARSSVSTDGLVNGLPLATLRTTAPVTFTVVRTGSGIGLDTNSDGQPNARLTTTSIATSNGYVHLIDAVLLYDVEPPEPPVPPRTVADVIAENPDLATFSALLAATEFDETLANPGMYYTVFAPTNAAMDVLLDLVDGDLAYLAELDGVFNAIRFHVAQNLLGSAHLVPGMAVITMRSPGLHFFTMVDAGGRVGIDSDGDGRPNARLIRRDIQADNGIIHVIDAFLLTADFPPDRPRPLDVVLNNQADFSILKQALETTGLLPMLADVQDRYTVFAPTNAAFEAFMTARGWTLQQLLAYDGLERLLRHHVSYQVVRTSDLAAGLVVPTLRFDPPHTFRIVAVGSGWGIDLDGNGAAEAKIVGSDLRAQNGAVHRIDAVLWLE